MVDTLVAVLDWFGRGSALILIAAVVWRFILWLRGVVPLSIRAGSIRQHTVAIFSNSENFGELVHTLEATSLFGKKNFSNIGTVGDLDSCDGKHVFIVNWADWGEYIDKILEKKTKETGVIVYALPGRIPQPEMEKLQNYNFVTVTNFKGRLITDLITMALAIRYARKQ